MINDKKMELLKEAMPELMLICKSHGLKIWRVEDLKKAKAIYESTRN